MHELLGDSLRSEYRELIASVGDGATRKEIIEALVREGEWTEGGAREVLKLAQVYGKFVLRNALALAEAMNIEDGSSRL